jgi:hypothetical protein
MISREALSRWHHDSAARTVRRIGRVRENHRQRNTFLGVLYPQRLCMLSSSAPIVIQTFRKFDAPGLIKILAGYFGVRCALSAGECLELPGVREVMGDISPRSLGGRLGEIAGEDFGSYRIEKIGEDRDGAVWWVDCST